MSAYRSFKRQCEAFGPTAPQPCFAGIIAGGLLVCLGFILIAGIFA